MLTRGLFLVWLTAAVVLFLVGLAFYVGVPVVAPAIEPQFKNLALYRPWDGWTSTYMVLHPFGFAVVFAGLYVVHRLRCEAVRGWRGGLAYGLAVFAVGSLPVLLLNYASFQASPEVIASWVLQSLCQYTAAGAAMGWVADRGMRQ